MRRFFDLAKHKFGSNVVEKCLSESPVLGTGHHGPGPPLPSPGSHAPVAFPIYIKYFPI